MRVKPTNPDHAVGLIDPQTRRSPFVDGKGKALESADVPDNAFWRRRLLAKEIEICDAPATAVVPAQPVAEPAILSKS